MLIKERIVFYSYKGKRSGLTVKAAPVATAVVDADGVLNGVGDVGGHAAVALHLLQALLLHGVARRVCSSITPV